MIRQGMCENTRGVESVKACERTQGEWNLGEVPVSWPGVMLEPTLDLQYESLVTVRRPSIRLAGSGRGERGGGEGGEGESFLQV